MNSKIHVAKGEKGKFKVLINGIQHGIELTSHELANNHALFLKVNHYPAATVFIWDNILECSIDLEKK